MKKLENFIQNFSKKIIACPVCHKKARVPIKVGKTLEITCPQCRTIFQITFRSSMHELFKWNKQQTFFSNIWEILKRLKNIPSFIQIIIYIGLLATILHFLNN